MTRKEKKPQKSEQNHGDLPAEQSKQQEIYKLLNRAINNGDSKTLDEILSAAHKNNVFDESIIRSGLQQAVRKANIFTLIVVITWGETSSILQRNDNLLRIALQEAAKQGHPETARILLEHGATTDVGGKGSSALWWAVTMPQTTGHLAVAQLLLMGKYAGCPADTEWRDEDGRTVFMSAAERAHVEVLELLLAQGADCNARDNNDRTILHVLAAASEKKYRHSDRCLELLLCHPIEIDRLDTTGRSALHWAAATGKTKLVEHLLTRRKHPPADANREATRGKTALHLACSAEPPNAEIVQLLLRSGADVLRTSDGSWTSLHHAAQVKGSAETIRALVAHSPSLLNLPTSTGMTALHVAASAGCADIVACLLTFPDTKINARDGFYWTPLLRAAGSGYGEIVQLLAPYNNPGRLSIHALHAALGFEATIVDFRAESQHQTLVQKVPVHQVLYGKDHDTGEPLVTTVAANVKTRVGTTKPLFRWIHLPANNIAWVEALIVKNFVESGSADIDGFKAVERSLGEQHRGPKHHSQFMKPLCQRTPRAMERADAEAVTPRQVDTTMKSPKQQRGSSPEASAGSRQKEKDKPAQGKEMDSPRGATRRHRAAHAKKISVADRERNRRVFSLNSDDSDMTGLAGDTTMSVSHNTSSYSGSNMVLFMPYLHYETAAGHLSQLTAIKRAETIPPNLKRQPSCNDEALIWGHLQSTTGLHIRRTLHQSYLKGVDTSDRDAEQVVSRYNRALGTEEKIFMVDQLWVYILGPQLIVTAFPRRWKQPKNDPLDLLDGVIQDVNSGMRTKRIVSPYELVALITARCSGVFDRHRADDETYRFLEIFEKSIGDVTYAEPTLYSNFYRASAIVHKWFKSLETDGTGARNTAGADGDGEEHAAKEYFAAVDRFLEIGEETALLQEIKDIREELHMIAMILTAQEVTLATLSDAVCEEFSSIRTVTTKGRDRDREQDRHDDDAREMERRFDDQRKLVGGNLAEIWTMRDQAEQLEQSLLNLLDLKQKQSNAFEARYARDQQAAGIVRQGQITLIFTLVTIVFLPVSFMAAFFAIPISDFPGSYTSAPNSNTNSGNSNSNGLPLGYVAKYTFGIGLGVSAVIIALAFNMDILTVLMRKIRTTAYGRFGDTGSTTSRGFTPRAKIRSRWTWGRNLTPYSRKMQGASTSFVEELRGKEMEMYGLMAAPSADRRNMRRSFEVHGYERASGDTRGGGSVQGGQLDGVRSINVDASVAAAAAAARRRMRRASSVRGQGPFGVRQAPGEVGRVVSRSRSRSRARDLERG